MSEPQNNELYSPAGHETPMEIDHPYAEAVEVHKGNTNAIQEIQNAFAEHGMTPAEIPASTDATAVPDQNSSIDHKQFEVPESQVEQHAQVVENPVPAAPIIPIPKESFFKRTADLTFGPISSAFKSIMAYMKNPTWRREGIKKGVENDAVNTNPIIQKKFSQAHAN